jgi:hypothetical protein
MWRAIVHCAPQRQGAKNGITGSVELAKQVLALAAIVLAVGTAFGIAAQKLRIPDVRCSCSPASWSGPPSPA